MLRRCVVIGVIGVLGSIGCGETGTTVIAHLQANPGLDELTRLHLTAKHGGAVREYDLSPPNPTIPPAIDIAIHVPPAARGTFEVAIDAFAGDTPIGHAENMLELVPGKATTLLLAFGAGSPQDLSGADLSRDLPATVVDLVGQDLVGADLVVLPDLASAEDLTPQPDLVPLLQPLAIAPSPWSFGAVDEGASSAAKSFTVQNQTPNASMAVTVMSPDAQFVVDVGTCGLNLAGNSVGTCTFSVTFSPNGAGPRSADIVVDAVTHRGVVTVSGIARGGLGDACNDDAHCQSGNCVDGFCCNTNAAGCAGCNACNVATKEGTCSPVPIGSDPKNFCTQACADKCDGAGACRRATAGTVCQTEACSNVFTGALPGSRYDSAATGIHQCTGAALTCPTATSACPGSLMCNTTTGQCRASCDQDTDCIRGKFCNASHICQSTLSSGQSCSRREQCASNVCDGTTCKAKCVTSADCATAGYNNGSICNNDECYSCGNQSQPPTNNLSCVGSGWGNSCVQTTSANFKECSCSSASECGDTAPLCEVDSDLLGAKSCTCRTGGSQVQCPPFQICVNSGASGVCRLRAGMPCVESSACASGTCSNNLCT